VVVLGSGSSGNATLLDTGKTRVLLDAGFSYRELGRRLSLVGEAPNGLGAVVLTHEHEDHLKGVDLLCRRNGVPVHCTAESWRSRRPPSTPEPVEDCVEIRPGSAFHVGDLRFVPFRVPHDAAECVGFRIETDGLVLGHVTDLGQATALVQERLRDCDALILESNHDVGMLRTGPYPPRLKQRIASRTGHMSNDAAARLLDSVWSERTRHVLLAHLSETNNHPEIALHTHHAALGERRDVTRVAVTRQKGVLEFLLE
jgi:phosphoribosyl 1,2-cyclic phosphodiesterase